MQSLLGDMRLPVSIGFLFGIVLGNEHIANTHGDFSDKSRRQLTVVNVYYL